jgi:hypothetical protein
VEATPILQDTLHLATLTKSICRRPIIKLWVGWTVLTWVVMGLFMLMLQPFIYFAGVQVPGIGSHIYWSRPWFFLSSHTYLHSTASQLQAFIRLTTGSLFLFSPHFFWFHFHSTNSLSRFTGLGIRQTGIDWHSALVSFSHFSFNWCLHPCVSRSFYIVLHCLWFLYIGFSAPYTGKGQGPFGSPIFDTLCLLFMLFTRQAWRRGNRYSDFDRMGNLIIGWGFVTLQSYLYLPTWTLVALHYIYIHNRIRRALCCIAEQALGYTWYSHYQVSFNWLLWLLVHTRAHIFEWKSGSHLELEEKIMILTHTVTITSPTQQTSTISYYCTHDGKRGSLRGH